MDKKKPKHRETLIDRLYKKGSEVIPIIHKKDKLKKIRDKLLEPRETLNERYDGWGDDIEEEIINETKTKRRRR